MPYENDKNRETRSGGKKTVTKKSSAASGAGRKPSDAGTQNSKPKNLGSASRSGSSAGSTSKPKAGTQSKTKSQSSAKTGRSANSQSAAKKTAKTGESTRSRADSSARDDYRRFSEDVRRKSREEEKSTPQKKPVQKSSGRSGEKRGKSRSRSKLTNVLTYIMIVFAFVALMVTLSLTVFFKMDSIEVSTEGAGYYSEDRIIKVSGLEEGQNIFSIDLEKVEAKIESELPYIENCEVRRALPTGIRITAISAEPAGILTLQTGTRIIISTEGKTLECLLPADGAVSDTDITEISATDASETDIQLPDIMRDHSAFIDETTLPEIVGIEVQEGMTPGEYIITEDETAMATLSQLTELLEKYSLPPDKIDLSAGKLHVYYDNRIMIRLGSGAELEAKIEAAAEIILNKLSEYDSGRVDVINPQKAYFTPEYLLKHPI